MYLGQHPASFTSGNRVAIPKKLLEKLGNEGIVITRGYEPCIVMVPKVQFEVLLDGIQNQPFILADKRQAARFLLSSAHEIEPDDQSRFVIPDNLMEHASISQGEKVVFIGVGSWIEIWNQNRWIEYQSELNQNAIEIAERLTKLKNE